MDIIQKGRPDVCIKGGNEKHLNPTRRGENVQKWKERTALKALERPSLVVFWAYEPRHSVLQEQEWSL